MPLSIFFQVGEKDNETPAPGLFFQHAGHRLVPYNTLSVLKLDLYMLNLCSSLYPLLSSFFLIISFSGDSCVVIYLFIIIFLNTLFGFGKTQGNARIITLQACIRYSFLQLFLTLTLYEQPNS